MKLTPYIANSQLPKINTKFDLHEVSATDLYGVGLPIADNIGGVFRWCHFNPDGADCGQSKVCGPECNDADVEGWLEHTAAITTITGGSVSGSGSAQAGGAPSIGDIFVRLTLATVFDSVVAGQYAGSRLCIAAGTGAGYSYVIKDNLAVSSSMVEFELHQPIKVALAASAGSDIMIGPSHVANLTIKNPNSDGVGGGVTGITMANIDVSDKPYGWVCTRGPVLALCEGSTTAGLHVTVDDAVAGAVMPEDAYTEPYLGYAIHTGTDDEYNLIMLTGGLD